MAHPLADTPFPAPDRATIMASPIYQAQKLLQIGFVAIPVIAGLDKFAHVLVNWDMYLAPMVVNMLPIGTHQFMMLVGIIEVLAGLLVAFKPRLGGYIVACWLWAIIANLLLFRGHYDVALRDFGLSLGALALARLSRD